MNGIIIGNAIDTIKLASIWADGGQICGYTNNKNIKQNTVPENLLVNLLNQGSTNLKDFEGLLSNLKFEKYDLYKLPEMTQYFIFESSLVAAEPEQDRITLLFNKNKTLVAIVNSRPLNTLKKLKTFKLYRGQLTITTNLKQEEINELKEQVDKEPERFHVSE